MNRLSFWIFSLILDLNVSVTTEGRPERSSSWTLVNPPLNIMHHFWTKGSFITSLQTLLICLKIWIGQTFFAFTNRITLRTSQFAWSLFCHTLYSLIKIIRSSLLLASDWQRRGNCTALQLKTFFTFWMTVVYTYISPFSKLDDYATCIKCEIGYGYIN